MINIVVGTINQTLIEMQIKHEASLVKARAIGIEKEVVSLWKSRCQAVQGTSERPPTLQDSLHDILEGISAGGSVDEVLDFLFYVEEGAPF